MQIPRGSSFRAVSTTFYAEQKSPLNQCVTKPHGEISNDDHVIKNDESRHRDDPEQNLPAGKPRFIHDRQSGTLVDLGQLEP